MEGVNRLVGAIGRHAGVLQDYVENNWRGSTSLREPLEYLLEFYGNTWKSIRGAQQACGSHMNTLWEPWNMRESAGGVANKGLVVYIGR